MATQQRSTLLPTRIASESSRRTGWYIAAAAVFVLGLVAAGAWAVFGVYAGWQAPDDFARTTLPGTVTVQVTDTGTQWLYYEHADETPVASLDQLGLRITGPEDEIVTPEATSLNLEYDAKAGDLGTAVATFEATMPGTYTVTATSTPASSTALAVGPSVADPLRTPLLGATAVFGLCLIASTGLVVTGLRRRT